MRWILESLTGRCAGLFVLVFLSSCASTPAPTVSSSEAQPFVEIDKMPLSFEFKSLEKIASNFQLSILFWVGMLLLVVFVVNYPYSMNKIAPQESTTSSPFKFLSATFFLSAIFFGLFALIIVFFSYTSNFGRFGSLRVIPDEGISITYFGLYPMEGRQEFVPIDNIKSIESERRGKELGGEYSCFIHIVTVSGPNHQSAYSRMSRSQCHNLQVHVVEMLCQPGSVPFNRVDRASRGQFDLCAVVDK